MDDVRIGRALRAIRLRRHLRQADVARRAGTSRETVGRLERGGLGRVPFDTCRAVARVLDISVDVRLRWRGGELDRVVNARHAGMHESVAAFMAGLPGWTWLPETTFSIYGERGVIDILAWHAETRSLLIIELKTELVDPQELVATMGRRVRLGTKIASEFGWVPLTVSAWVVVLEGSTNRRRHHDHGRLLQQAFPHDGHRVRAWLRDPSGRIAALSFWSEVGSGPHKAGAGQVKRVRVVAH